MIWKTRLDTHGRKQDVSLPLCGSRGGGQNVLGVYFPEKREGGGIDTPPPTLAREEKMWF